MSEDANEITPEKVRELLEERREQERADNIKQAMPWLYDGDEIDNSSGRFTKKISNNRKRNCNIS